MVNFDDGNTVMRNKKEIQEITILQRRYETINKLKQYKARKYKQQNEEYALPEVQAELIALYYETDSIIEKDLLKPNKKNLEYTQLKEIEEDIESDKESRILKAWNYINTLLYRQHLTQVDSNKEIDWSDPEEVNEEHEL